MNTNRKEMLPIFIGNRIRQKREELLLTQTDLSSKLGVSRASISNIESGRHVIQINTLYDLSEILKENVSYFLPNIDSEEFRFQQVFYSDTDFINDDVKRSYIDDIINSI